MKRLFAGVGLALSLVGSSVVAQGDFPYTSPNSPSSIPCYGDGQSGKRIQMVLVHGTNQSPFTSDRKQQIRDALQRADWYLNKNALESSNQSKTRHYRFVHNSNCLPTFSEVMVPQSVMATGSGIEENIVNRAPQEFNRSDRIYVFIPKGDITDDNAWGDLRDDDRDTQSNTNNQGARHAMIPDTGVTYGFLHEVGHVLGAVQNSAPHEDGGRHANDYPDVMGGLLSYWFDRNYDDYFDAQVEPGEYLDTHWNLADSAFLGQ